MDVKYPDGTSVKLDDEQVAFFMLTGGRMAVDLYHHPNTRASQHKVKEGFIIHMSGQCYAEVTPDLERLLDDYKNREEKTN
jgi:hypothetical protein